MVIVEHANKIISFAASIRDVVPIPEESRIPDPQSDRDAYFLTFNAY